MLGDSDCYGKDVLTLYKQKVICILNEIMLKINVECFLILPRGTHLEGVLQEVMDGWRQFETCSIIVIYMSIFHI